MRIANDIRMLSVGFAPLVFIQFLGSRVPPTTSIQKIGFETAFVRNLHLDQLIAGTNYSQFTLTL